MTPFEKIPLTIRHYILDWKYCNPDGYPELMGERKLEHLSSSELVVLYDYIVKHDRDILLECIGESKLHSFFEDILKPYMP